MILRTWLVRNRFVKGDLVYIPQAVHLFTHRTNARYFSMNMRLKVPRNCLVLDVDEENDYVTVLYDGEQWLVKEKDVYPASNEARE